MNYTEARRDFVTWVERNLKDIEFENITQNPLELIDIGLLFPRQDDTEVKKSTDSNVVSSMKPPSSVGFSFYITDDGEGVELSVELGASVYKPLPEGVLESKTEKIKSWEKQVYSPDGNFTSIVQPSNGERVVKTEVFFDQIKEKHRATLHQIWRPYNDGFIVTLTLTNNQKEKAEKANTPWVAAATLFNVSLRATPIKGVVQSYPKKDFSLLTEEERELELRYKDIKVFGIGHAAAVNWNVNSKGKVVLETSFMPKVEVPSVTANTAGDQFRYLSFDFLTKSHKDSEVIEELRAFVNSYGYWIEEQVAIADSYAQDEKETADGIVAKAKEAKERMDKGVTFLEQSKSARIAFSYANAAMLKQMLAGKKEDKSKFNWRPFQLAFVLMTMQSVVNEDDEYRDLVDLIWFPTGGGKTEAYLGVMVFLFVYRRCCYPDSSSGTACIMRYTLRLLTSQQFARASKVIFALELLRRKNSALLGTEPFTLGLWVGAASTANTYRDTQDAINEGRFEKLGMTSCPWCKAGFTRENYLISDTSFSIKCTNSECDFGKSDSPVLPFNSIDEALYENPPTLLIATVDKFAMLAWEARAQVFFGLKQQRPPELIIQDELHLISGELGSMVGLYEVGIESALVLRGIYPKYIASTATIRNAEHQIKLLYGKKQAVFPPAGISYKDSYFAKTVPTSQKPGRMYVGYMAYNKPRQRCLAPLASLIACAPVIHQHSDPELQKAWWTQMLYHGSLKGVGISQTLIEGEVGRRIQDITDRYNRLHSGESEYKKIEPRRLNTKTLTSMQGAESNNAVFNALEKEKDTADCVDVALATNMVSVGLDVERLAVMIINGQPLTTAEYIQASSRVGRGDIPGIVFVNFYKSQTRSLSHYENFCSYHDSFYRYVEPTSLTPFTYQAVKRALHSSLVVAVRMGGIGLAENDSADYFDKDNPKIKRLINQFRLRIGSAICGPFEDFYQNEDESEKLELTLSTLDDLVDEWDLQAKNAITNRRQLQYNSRNDRGADSLLKTYSEEKKAVWSAMTSMRSVENSALMKTVKGIKHD
ncbi:MULTISPECIES: helicase-related protein [Shewanella]|uniref:Helicase n=1 Tax=Shewanella marisflavi TaxID=260364 RepID=A0ABX5WL23_9GAMM|nr:MULTISPECIES: helicase-related protein [Shewanella]QDF75257.1 helicase [Shewanella marisflavi]